VTLTEAMIVLATTNILSFGNAAVMVVLLQRAFVQDAGLLTNEQLLYAFAIARVTPGQANLYVGGIGYMMFGVVGAIASMAVIVLPSYVMLPLVRGYHRYRENRRVAGFTRGLSCTAAGIVLAIAVKLGADAAANPVSIAVIAAALGLLALTRLPTILCLGLASLVGVAGLALRGEIGI
jgi:chromate transporter